MKMKIFYWMILAVNVLPHRSSLLTGNGVSSLPVVLWLIVFCVLFSGCGKSPDIWHLEGKTMGTRYHITIINPPHEISQNKLNASIDKTLVHINQLMSTYIDDSELSRFNNHPVGEWFTLSPETFDVIQYSLELSEKTDGKFDITISPLIRLWGFDKDKLLTFPDEKTIENTKQNIGWQSLTINKTSRSIKKNKPLSINLSAVAKGYGVDHIAKLLEAQGINHYLVEIGGEIRVKGKNANAEKWRLGIETPSLLQTGVQQVVSLSDQAIATSGDYRNFFEHDGVKYSHTIDPKTGKPAHHNIASLTVIAHTAMEADGIATALMVLGEKQAIAFANRYNIPVYMLLYKEDVFTTCYSKEFRQYIQ